MPMSDGLSYSEIQALNRLLAAKVFSNTVDTDRKTTGIYIAEEGGLNLTVHCAKNDEDVAYVTAGEWLILETDEALAGADVASLACIIYCYAGGD